MHSKVAIIDDLVVTGSPNWSMNAWSNNEAALFIADAAVADAYAAELDGAWDTASVP
jgi:phosphatidylserine/phosphatidylglycerophosphate/cardiolipin synthase-like enzyme